MQGDLSTLDGLYQSTLAAGCGPYEPSIASSASSSQASIFSSSEPASTQSSIASSVSDDFRLNQEDAKDRAYALAQIQQSLQNGTAPQPQCGFSGYLKPNCRPAAPSYADVTSVPRPHQQQSRRSSRSGPPPKLQRQCERKVNFVESLVDSATQMVEVIWPLSMSPCRSEGSAEKSVLPLRSYIEETLRRSKTSYSTLQVALYYLVLIKSYVPKRDFTQEQGMDCPATRALMCGRRMFLAALILASKYLQDRNYSAKAWSKMSGLKVGEINFNERTFLSKISWKLHIPEPLFKKWTLVVLEYTPHTQPPPPPPSPGQSLPILPPTWKSIIPLLNAELNKVPLTGLRRQPSMQYTGNYGTSGVSTPTTPTPTKRGWNLTPSDQLQSMSHEGTPTPSTVLPRYLEPTPAMEPPALPRMGPLPTPQMTPSTVATNTPAASACSSRRPSIASAMAMANSNQINRCAIDAYPCGRNPAFSSRRPSITSVSSRSSPESMITDRSRSSRASSISSVSTTSSLAPTTSRHCLAKQATCRNAGLPVPTVYEEKEGSATKPIIINEDADIMSSPDMADFSIPEKVLTRPDKHSKHGSSSSHHTALTSSASSKSRKRPRSWRQSGGHRRSHLQEEVREMLEEAEEDLMDIDDDVDDEASSSDSSTDVSDAENIAPSPAAEYAARILSRSNSNSKTYALRPKEVQPPPSLTRSGSGRVPVQRFEGSMKKRTCCSTDYAATAAGLERGLLYGEVA